MRLSVSGDHLNVGPRLREYIDRHLSFALARFDPAIDYVDVRLGDTNGPRGGVDKYCRIVVKLRAGASTSVAINDVDENLHAAIARAAARVGRTVARTLDRKRGKRIYQRRRALAEEGRAVAEDVGLDG
jgi:ribosome-associated translation inhibitor RaiA